ncbi:hypothetical protein PMAYCL1PPCAC_19606, partial [Pristionchus mayeri]
LMESRVVTTILKVCNDKMAMEEAVKEILFLKMIGKTIAECFCTALLKLPLSNTWNVVLEKMATNAIIFDVKEALPKVEKNLFELLNAIRDKEPVKLANLIHNFYNAYLDIFLNSVNKYNNSTAEITRNVRCLFLAHVAANKTQGIHLLFHDILMKQSSEAVCQSLVYLFCNPQTKSLASNILSKELMEFGGRLITMHLNDKDTVVLKWAVDRFADFSCQEDSRGKLRPATLKMVQGWWDSDMKNLEKARDRKLSVRTRKSGIKFDEFHSSLVVTMSSLLSSQFTIGGLDRVKLLSQLIKPAIDAIDRATSSPSVLQVAAPLQVYLDASEGRVVVLKIHTAISAMNSIYNFVTNCANEREALPLYLTESLEKTHYILGRPICSECDSLQKEDYLPLCISVLKEWKEIAEKITKKDSMETPSIDRSDSSPVKKRTRREEQGEIPVIVIE